MPQESFDHRMIGLTSMSTPSPYTVQVTNLLPQPALFFFLCLWCRGGVVVVCVCAVIADRPTPLTPPPPLPQPQAAQPLRPAPRPTRLLRASRRPPFIYLFSYHFGPRNHAAWQPQYNEVR